jgi:DUF1365 family protein
MTARIYRGVIAHARPYPVAHAFVYPTWMISMSLADLEQFSWQCPWFGYNRVRLCSIWDRDYLEPNPTRIALKLANHLGRDPQTLPVERIHFLTVPRVFMTGFNPLSLFACLDIHGHIEALVAEVHNTYQEAHLYVLRRDDPATQQTGDGIVFRFPKQFFVSPFNGVDGEYRLAVSEPFDSESLLIQFDLVATSKTIMRTRLRLSGEPLSPRALATTAIRHPFTAAMTLPRIAHQALMLRWRKKLKPRIKPLPISSMTIRQPGKAHRPPM